MTTTSPSNAPASSCSSVRRILGIDPGARCGWAICERGRIVVSGVWSLREDPYSGAGQRWLELRRRLRILTDEYGRPDQVVYEKVAFTRQPLATYLYGALVGTLQLWCETRDPVIPYVAFTPTSIKKHATGRGNAGKDAMVKAARGVIGCAHVEDDNEADAIHIARMGWDRYGEAT